MGDGRVLSYHDCLLREADVDLLRGPHWLNDQLISFWMEHLQRGVLADNVARSVCLIPGSMAFLLLHADPSEAAAIFESLQLHEKQLVVFAVNDNPDVSVAAGGSHWSCLAFWRATNTFRHYDSAAPHNHGVARSLAGAASPLVRRRAAGGSGGTEGEGANNSLPSFVEVESAPQQRNGSDCGLYCLAVTQALCGLLAEAGAGAGGDAWSAASEQAALKRITPPAAAQLRAEVLSTIERLAAAGATAARGGGGGGGGRHSPH